MESTFFTIVTDSGTEKILDAVNNGKKVNITEFAVGDGNGEFCIPQRTDIGLKNEVWRGLVSACYISEEYRNLLVVESVIPSDVGGFTIREMGLFDEEGVLIAVCNTPDTQKAEITAGIIHELDLSMEIALENAEILELITDPNILTATKKDIENLRSDLESQIETISDETNMEDSFYAVFTLAKLTDSTSMTSADISSALERKWNGESSEDITAMSPEDISSALERKWNGETSEDETALQTNEIADVIKI